MILVLDYYFPQVIGCKMYVLILVVGGMALENISQALTGKIVWVYAVILSDPSIFL